MPDTLPEKPSAEPPGWQPPDLPWWRYVAWLIVLLAFSWFWWAPTEQAFEELTYSQLKTEIREDHVNWVEFQGDRISGEFSQPGTAKGSSSQKMHNRFISTRPPIDDPELISLLEKHGVEIRAISGDSHWIARAIIGVVPWLLIIGLFWYATTRMQQRIGGMGLFDFGKSRARRFRQTGSNPTFDDVAGLENAKLEMHEIVGYLKDPGRYRKLGAEIPRGILLMGPPGTGKTLLARAVAGEAQVPYFSISGSEFIEMFVGVGASRVRDMFASARKEAPSIIFIDEIDSVGRARGTGLGGGNDEREQTLNQILGEMDGFDPHEAVVVLAATNRPDVLDAALLRPGRFDRKITLDLPDRKARRAILGIHSAEVPLDKDADLDRIAALTVGFSGADLENLINEAALLSGRDDRDTVDMDALLGARDKVVLGGRREMIISDEEKSLVAYHESGHAVIASRLQHTDPLDKVSIIPRGRALGVTEQIPEEEHYNLRNSYLRDRIGVMLGGRAAEKLVFGEVSSGAEDDLKQATRLARLMISHWGMSERLGPVAFQRGEEHIFLGREMTQQRDFSEHTAQVIDDEICALLQDIEKQVAELLARDRATLDSLAAALLEKETLESDELDSILHHDEPASLTELDLGSA
ncbi:MAG TPA: ATP-dependent zinc metalloprotease FtsH [Gammaproteobacteria bacterium]|nr:ATP-dependent zinc metalloprotease FtsH [Gammaproteobacteria bacterium]